MVDHYEGPNRRLEPESVLEAVLDTLEQSNQRDHSLIRERIDASETRLGKQIHEGFADLREKVDRGLKEEIQALEGRMGRLENWRYYIAGGLVVVGLLVSTLGVLIVPRIIDSQAAITRHLIQEAQTETWHTLPTTTTLP